MAEQEMPGHEQAGNERRDRESASGQPARRFPREDRPPTGRAATPDLGESDAARRQARQDPLQRRDR